MSNQKINVLRDIYKFLKLHNKSAEDVLWVGSNNGAYAISWETFAEVAKHTYYYTQRDSITQNLVVVGKNWWLQRSDEPFLDTWDFFSLPQLQSEYSSFDGSSEHFNILSNED